MPQGADQHVGLHTLFFCPGTDRLAIDAKPTVGLRRLAGKVGIAFPDSFYQCAGGIGVRRRSVTAFRRSWG
jgi:hypothetical protein